MKIGLTMRETLATGYHEVRDSLSREWVELVESWGATPYYIPNNLKDVSLFIKENNLDLIILTGGNDLSENLSGIPVPSFSKPRDETESKILDVCLSKNLPVLGVCRGMQMINCYLSGKLVPVSKDIHVAKNHDITLSSAFWEKIFGASKISVNSFHNFGISEKTLAQSLNIIARSSDGCIEAFCHSDKPILGIMWHPERKNPKPIDYFNLVKNLIDNKVFWKNS